MKLVSSTDPILLGVAEPVTFPAPLLSQTISQMLEFMVRSHGCGLAAPQIGLGIRLFTYSVGRAMGAVVNPEIVERSPEEIEYREGCLTFPGKLFTTRRNKWVTVRYQDMSGRSAGTRRFDGLMAIVFQHESDHLDGRLVSHHGVEA